MRARGHIGAILLVGVLLLIGVAGVFAEEDRDDDEDYERASRLQSQGVIVSLARIVAKVQQAYPGSEVLELEFKDEKDTFIYELEIVDKSGVVRELYYDARSAELIKEKREH